MESGKEFLAAITEATEQAFEEHGPGAERLLDKLCEYVSDCCDSKGIVSRQRDRVIYFEGMLRGVQLQFLKRKHALEAEANKLGIDPRTGLVKGTKTS